MTRARVTRIWAIVAGMLVAVLGILHNLGVANVFRDLGFYRLSSLARRGFIYMYLGVGLTWVFCGLLLLASGRGLARNAPWAWPLAFAAALLMLVFGMGAMVIMPDNPPAYAIVGCAVVATIPFLLSRPSERR